jgi:HEAT repeat protein
MFSAINPAEYRTVIQPPFQEGNTMIAEGDVRQQCSPLPTSDEIYCLIENTGDHTEYLTRIAAISALGNSRDPRAVIPLTICCRDRNTEIRRYAVEALSILGSVRSIPALSELVQDRSEDVIIRRKALLALAGIKSSSALDAIAGLTLDENEDPAIRMLAARMSGRKK